MTLESTVNKDPASLCLWHKLAEEVVQQIYQKSEYRDTSKEKCYLCTGYKTQCKDYLREI